MAIHSEGQLAEGCGTAEGQQRRTSDFPPSERDKKRKKRKRINVNRETSGDSDITISDWLIRRGGGGERKGLMRNVIILIWHDGGREERRGEEEGGWVRIGNRTGTKGKESE